MDFLKGTQSPVDPLRGFANEVERQSSLRSRRLAGVVLPAGSGLVEFSHGLGQPYTGIVILGISDDVVVTPALASKCSDATKRAAVWRTSSVALTINVEIQY